MRPSAEPLSELTMIDCGNYQLEKWQPDFSSSGQSSPEWIRVKCSDVKICNSLEWLDWEDNPVQVEICDACGTPGCQSGGYVHVSRLGEHILWTKPYIDESDEWARTQYEAAFALRKAGSVVIPDSVLSQWQRETNKNRSLNWYPRTTRADLAAAWFMEKYPYLKMTSIKDVIPYLRKELLGADTLDVTTAIDRTEALVEWFVQKPEQELRGELMAPWPELTVETLYFDGPAEKDWPAFAIDEAELFPAFGKNWVYRFHPDER